MRFQPAAGRPHTLTAMLGSRVEAVTPYTTPWRFVMVADTPVQLLAHHSLVLNLNDPVRDCRHVVDQAGQGHPRGHADDGGRQGVRRFRRATMAPVRRVRRRLVRPRVRRRVGRHDRSTVDPERSAGPLDLPEVIRYAGERGIGIILYVNHRALERQLDEILPLYQQWGVKGVKFGFVNVGSQQWTDLAARGHSQGGRAPPDGRRPRRISPHRLLAHLSELDDRGRNRRRRDQPRQLVDADHPLHAHVSRRGRQHHLLLTTPGWTATPVMPTNWPRPSACYSPWQFLYWYDRPPASPRKKKKGDAGNVQTAIYDEQELDFYAAMPTVWDETRVLEGKIGEYAVIARRRGDQWFLGCMNANKPRTFALRLDFLDPGKSYVARVYADDPSVPHCACMSGSSASVVNADSVLRMAVSAQGGEAIRLCAKTCDSRLGALQQTGAFCPCSSTVATISID